VHVHPLYNTNTTECEFMLSFAQRFTDATTASPFPFIEKLYLTNSVLHCSAPIPGNPTCTTQRAMFWGTRFVSSGATRTLQLCSNEDTRASNFRVDTNVGRFLSFTRDHNHIRAGKHSPTGQYKFDITLVKRRCIFLGVVFIIFFLISSFFPLRFFFFFGWGQMQY
jgi:hypothetical protein